MAQPPPDPEVPCLCMFLLSSSATISLKCVCVPGVGNLQTMVSLQTLGTPSLTHYGPLTLTHLSTWHIPVGSTRTLSQPIGHLADCCLSKVSGRDIPNPGKCWRLNLILFPCKVDTLASNGGELYPHTAPKLCTFWLQKYSAAISMKQNTCLCILFPFSQHLYTTC